MFIARAAALNLGTRFCLRARPHLADVGPEHLLNIKSGIERRENM